MDKKTKEIIAIRINHLIQERQRIEDASDLRIDRDLRATYNFITEEIARLNLELFQDRYKQYEENLNKAFRIEGAKEDAIS